MKSLKHNSFVLLALCFLLITSMKCKKDYIEKNELPPITQKGANTFGCYVNGEIFLPRGGVMYGGVVTATKTGSNFYIKMRDDHSPGGIIILEIESTQQNISTLNCTKISRVGNCSTENCTAINNNIVNLKIDESKKTISGQFDAILPATATCPEIRITEGRFDLKYTEN